MEKTGVMDAVARDVQTLFGLGVLGTLSDGQLLRRFVERREGDVFEAVIRRHGPMVWGVCRRVLRDHHDAEDAFQATFLVLARKAATVIPREKLGNWLYGVAYQTAMMARAQRTKRQGREAQVSDVPEPLAKPSSPQDELAESLDRELNRLPETYRTPIVLCDLEGWTHQEAASQLGWPVGTVSSRLSRGRAMLARRLSRGGLSLSAGSLAVLLAGESASAVMPARLIGPTAEAASLFAAGGAATAGAVSAKTAALTAEVMKIMLLSKIKVMTAMALLASALVAGGAGFAYRAQGGESGGQTAPPGDVPLDLPKDDQPDKKSTGTADRPESGGPKAPAPDLPPPSLPSPNPPEIGEASSGSSEQTLSLPDDSVPQPREALVDRAPAPTPDEDQPAEDPLAELIMTRDHTPEQLERAKELIEAMITLDKEAHGKSPEEIDEMIQDKASELQDARRQARLMDAQLRRLKAIKQKTHAPVTESPTP